MRNFSNNFKKKARTFRPDQILASWRSVQESNGEVKQMIVIKPES